MASESKSVKTVAAQLVLVGLFLGGCFWAFDHYVLADRRPAMTAKAVGPGGVVGRDRSVPATNPSPRTVDLLAGLDVAKATVNGVWTAKDRGLASDEGQATRFDFGYRPPAEYDLRLTLTRVTGNDGIDLVLAHAGRQFVWTMAGWDNHVCGFGDVMAVVANANPTTVTRPAVFENGRRYDCLVRVRRDRVAAYIDGQLVSQWPTDYDDLGSYTRGLLRPDTIGVSTWESSYAIRSASVVEVAGTGAKVSAGDPIEAAPIAVCEYAVANHPGTAEYTLYSNGRIKNADGTELWFRKGNHLCFEWGPFLDRCTLASEGKTFDGFSPKREPVHGQFTAGGL